MILQLSSNDLKLLMKEVHRVSPIEACALLFGEIVKENRVIRKVVLAQNKLKSTGEFTIDPQMVVSELSKAADEELDFVGLFHSHSAPSQPSIIDLTYMKLWGDVIWVIYSLTEKKLAAFQLKNGKTKEILIKTENNRKTHTFQAGALL